ncbi:hypothetical protein OAU50_03655 [Planctomycetota bacterium]|nr:hypothetical protein [Planctomycetota bacterium]
MNETEYMDAARRLELALAKIGIEGRFKPEFSSMSNALVCGCLLSNVVVSFCSSIDPLGLYLPGPVEELGLYSFANLVDSQVGYRHGVGTPDIVDEDWNPNWIVIGDISADPIILDSASETAAVYVAMHGQGTWDPIELVAEFADFVLLLAKWVELLAAIPHASSGFDIEDVLSTSVESIIDPLTDEQQRCLTTLFE